MGKSAKKAAKALSDNAEVDNSSKSSKGSQRALVIANDEFFSNIISMIPRELYKPDSLEEDDEAHAKYFKHKKLALPSEVKKSITKRKIAEKYGSTDASTASGAADDGGDDAEEGDEVADTGAAGNNYDNMQTLRERLQARIATMKQSRMSQKRAFEPSLPGEGSRRKLQKKQHQTHSANKVKGMADSSADVEPSTSSDGVSSEGQTSSSAGREGDHAESGEMDIDFGNFAGDSSRPTDKFAANKGKPGTKKQRLERMLESAENRRARLQDLRNSGKEGAARLKEEHWNDVIKSAQGVDQVDTQKVKKALKRREKEKQKSAQEWSTRKKAVDDAEKAKINKRETNLNARKKGGLANEVVTEEDVKAEKKQGGRNKEKALANRRPGFEGKSGTAGSSQFLNSKMKKKEARASSKAE